MDRCTLTKATLGRLPTYLNYLKSVVDNDHVSATTIAKALSLGEVQVRKDLNAVSGAGRPKVGYETDALINRIERVLGAEELTPVILVGAGKIGKALLDYGGFNEFGVDIIAAFDRNSEAFEFGNKGKKILPMDCFESFCKERKVQIGIVTVGANAAQQVCDIMVKSGIKAIWNFAPCRLDVPSDVIVKQENLALSLAHLNNQRNNLI
ncbi:MAG: redox-sensing transcriptional repressor Rex [Clostridiales bacterium]|nr:redox-sensing transcriptional repressor Rex [Clostridiales bacterium]